jgi:hypothetical protein
MAGRLTARNSPPSSGTVRNPAPESLGIALQLQDLAPLAAFLRVLNEDYE